MERDRKAFIGRFSHLLLYQLLSHFMTSEAQKPVVLLVGAAGRLGLPVVEGLQATNAFASTITDL